MNLDCLLFPAPKFEMKMEIVKERTLIWIPSYEKNENYLFKKKLQISIPGINNNIDSKSNFSSFTKSTKSNLFQNKINSKINNKYDFFCLGLSTTKNKLKLRETIDIKDDFNENVEENESEFKRISPTKCLEPKKFFNNKEKSFLGENIINKKISHRIPCLLLDPLEENETDLILLYFHGNGEDIFTSYELTDSLRKYLNVKKKKFPFKNFFY